MPSANYPIPRNRMSNIERAVWRVFSKADVREWDKCWEFRGATTSNGYSHVGQVDLFGEVRTNQYGHRTVWAVFNGRWPTSGEVVQHTCDNPPCVNPAHLIVGTQADNVATRPRSGRWFGGRTGKLTPEQVLIIRASTKPQTELAREFGVSQTAVSNVISGKTYGADGKPKVRHNGGPSRKLSNAAVRDICASTDSAKALAARHNVSVNLIYRVRSGEAYSDVL